MLNDTNIPERTYLFYVLVSSDDLKNVRYVGVTSKKNVKERFAQHKYCAMHPEKRGLPVHKWMYSKYKKGLDIIVKQIDSCKESEWESREQYWTSYYKEKGYDLMNIDKGGRGVITKEKRSKSSIQRSIEGHNIPIIALYKDSGKFYKEYKSSAEAAKALGLKSSTAITNVINGWTKSSKGFIFVKKVDYDPNKEYIWSNDHEKFCIKVYQFDLNGKMIKQWKSFKAVDKLKGYSENGLRAAIRNKRVYHDCYWSLSPEIDISEFKSIYNFYTENIKTKSRKYFKTLNEIAEYLDYKSAGTISIAIKNHTLTKNHYIYKL